MADYQEFPLFSLLPSEIRLEIWSMAACVPHTLSIDCKKPARTSEIPQWSSSSPAPAILSVNSEARRVALSFYAVLSFPHESIRQPSRPLYINFSSDAISLAKDMHSLYARTLLEKTPQFKNGLRRIILTEMMWGMLNAMAAVPGPMIDSRWDCVGYSMDYPSVLVTECLKSLEEVTFHGSDSRKIGTYLIYR
ncbi:hypothetical protein PVAG01_00923 [Phlyctema vagabunda]|uniref:2EXR domain-containing protein n=1 Tax=Phlyctema vagabunda TaxID=108571 RepID=A0ABR4PVN2_9HELO